MKKLMFAALAVSTAGGAFASPLVYDYKASVKHMYSKPIKVMDMFNVQQEVYQKVLKSATLRGFLVVDNDAATSLTYMTDRGEAVVAPGVGAYAPTTIDHGLNRAFLVVRNPGAHVPTGVAANRFRTAKVLPANLEVNFIDQFKFNPATGFPNATTGTAEGYLYVGGETVAPVRPKLDILAAGITDRGAAMVPPAAATAGMSMIQDYVWTSCCLFGQFNSPDFMGRTINPGWWQVAQTAVDAGFEAGVSLAALTATWTAPWAGEYYYHDTWMNGSGFGKFSRASGAWCCGFGGGISKVLESLSGNLKGGLFLCTYQGLQVHGGIGTAWLNAVNTWEDQWFVPAWGGIGSDFAFAGANTFAGDQDQIDLWQDGPFELNTTDCITGTWSIKRRKSNIPSATVELPEIRALTANNAAVGTEASTGLLELLETIKGCALQLNNNTIFTLTTSPGTANAALQNEIFSRINTGSATRWELPALTPAFAQYYGLANFN